METKKTITVTVPASEPQTTTKEINVPSYWKKTRFGSTSYLLIITNTHFRKIVKQSDKTIWVDNYNRHGNDFFSDKDVEEISESEASEVFESAIKTLKESVFGDQQEQFDQAIQSYTEQNFVTDKPIIERKHTEFE